MTAAQIIAKQRDRVGLSPAEIDWFAKGLANGDVTDAQAGAFAMAVLLNGLNEGARVALTKAMRDSGDTLHWDLPGPVLDKHSTGGVGDCVSLVLAPALAACGAYVPMLSGRGLGHTGGTLDKLEAIPGYRGNVSEARLRAVVGQVGCAIVGATDRIAPADRRLYGIRDVTGTVESIDLITASILSKKLAAGLGGLVLDVKTGSGAFMADRDDARQLAETLVRTAKGAGCATTALITDMSQPLVPAAGNALEIIEVIHVLTDAAPGRLLDLTCALGGEVLATSGMAADVAAGAGAISQAISSGAAAEIFGQMVAALGGPADFLQGWAKHLPVAPVELDLRAPTGGVVQNVDCRALGMAVVALGGGRTREGERINPAVGLSGLAGIGQAVAPGAPLARVHAADKAAAAQAEATVRAAYTLAENPVTPPPLIYQKVA